MNAREFQIGDFVQNTNGDKGRVVGFDFLPTSRRNEIVIAYADNLTSWSDESLIKPIPFSEEIIKLNGFERRGGDLRENGYFYFEKDGVIIELLRHGSMEVWFDERKGRPAYLLPMPFSVDDFQHSLRVLGLYDLAENLKVKEG